MATQPRDKDTPKRTSSHRIADLSVNHVERIFLEAGHVPLGTSSGNSARRSSTSRKLSYGHLAKALAKLGYRSEEQRGSHVVFRYEGRPSVILPWRAATSKVDTTRLAGVYQLVSGSGVTTRQNLEQLLIEPQPASNGAKSSARHGAKRPSVANE